MNRDVPEAMARGPSPVNPKAGLAQTAYGESGAEQCALRQKYWSELKEHERIDRTREYVKRLESRLEMAEAFIRTLMEHKHDAAGGLVGPVDPYRHMPKSIYAEKSAYAAKEDARNSDDIYF